jgi:hypothetical protein
MELRKLSAFIMLLLLSVMLVACSGEEDEPEPTAAPTQPPVSTRISESLPESTPDDGETELAATPDSVMDNATPAIVATPTVAFATPSSPSVVPATLVATPVATPVFSGSVRSGSPVASPEVSRGATPASTPMPTGLNEPPARIEMAGLVILDGRENEAFIVTDEGCVGLGPYSGLHSKRQVVIRNEEGTIVSVTTLEPSDDVDGCGWQFVAAVPESEFYSVSIPMVFEQVFPKAQVAESDGAVTITLP